jgi:hypothetical protein
MGAADPYEGMTDEQVLALAARHLQKVDLLPIGSTERNIKWAAYESAKAELDRRFINAILRAIREHPELLE